jgi:hypothetical protein
MRWAIPPSRRDVIAALAGLPALSAFLAACGPGGAKVPRYDGEIVGGSATLGHRLLAGDLHLRPVARTERTGTAILGGGISGLSAAWTLARAGYSDFQLYEAEPELGGNARSGSNAVSKYPWAAHYVPVPAGENPALEALLEEAGAIAERSEDGRPVWDEAALIREPEERLYFHGQWVEGLYPRLGATRSDLEQFSRFEQAMRAFSAVRDAKGRRAFALPRRHSSPDAEFAVLDRLSMAEWLAGNGYTSRRLLWFVEYGCRDDFGSSLAETSAWAGIHYFAARLEGTSLEDDPAPFLTWPEGNGRLVAVLAKPAAGKLRTGALVFEVAPSRSGVVLRYYDPAHDEVVQVEARHAVCAMPHFVARYAVAPLRERGREQDAIFDYAPWLVANVTLRDRPEPHGFPMAWDNVIYSSKSLGYVVATHQAGSDYGPTVLTWYHAFAGEATLPARRKLLSASWADLAATVVADLSLAHRDIGEKIERIDLYRWGHAMARPSPGTLFNPGRRQASEAIGRLRFAHADLSGLPLFEEANDAGVRAAESILSQEKLPFSRLAPP